MTDAPIGLVTGAARGTGHAYAEAVAETGTRVVLADIDTDGVNIAAEKIGGDAVGTTCDIGDPAQITVMFDHIEAEFGPVSILVNNAGIARPGDFLETSLEQFQSVIDVNLIGMFVAIQRAAKTMAANGIEDAIINMSSINARVAIPWIAAYCASKGGVMQMTKAAALALAPHNIRVNAVGPGSIDTEMMASVNAEPGAMATILSSTPLKRLGTPREIVEVVAFSPAARPATSPEKPSMSTADAPP